MDDWSEGLPDDRPARLRAVPLGSALQEALARLRAARSAATTSSPNVYAGAPEPPRCPLCGFAISPTAHGWLDVSADPRVQQLEPCPECSPSVRAARLTQRIARMGLGGVPEYGAAWEWSSLRGQDGLSPSQATAIDTAQQFAAMAAGVATAEQGTRRGLYLWGDYGVGKTSIAVCVMKEALYEGRAAAYLPTVELFDALRTAYRSGQGEQADEYMRMASDAEVLVLDDLAVERPTSWVLEQVYLLLERRMRTPDRWTVITSNRSLEGLDTMWLAPRWVGSTLVPPSEADEMQVGRIVQRLGRHCHVVEVAGRNLAEVYEPEGEA